MGSGTTDIAYSTTTVSENESVNIETHKFTSILKAGDNVDKKILELIKIYSVISEDVLENEIKCKL